MEYIHSKDIFLLMRDTLKLSDRRVMDHGSRVAYFLYKMLECRGGYEKFELADLVLLASLHDIGAYKTEDLSNTVKYECRDTMAHAAYGYLFFKNLSPLSELAGAILYHHTDYVKLSEMDYTYKDIASYLNVAEKADILLVASGGRFDISLLKKQVGKAIGEEAFSLFEQAVRKYDMLNRVKSGDYKEELDDIINYMIFSNEDKKKYLEMLMFCQGFRSEYSVVNTVTAVCIADKIAGRINLKPREREQLYYGTLLHDIGMLAIPKEIIEAPRTLTPEETKKMQMHVHLAERSLKNRMDEEIVEIVAAHHERGDGSGYPRGLRERQMNLLQQILQVADTATAMMNKRPYRRAFSDGEIARLLKNEAEAGKYSRVIVKIFLNGYEDVWESVKGEADRIMKTYRKINEHYERVSGKF